jgi:hypothetical protein
MKETVFAKPPPTTLSEQTGTPIRTTLFQPDYLLRSDNKVECTTQPPDYANFAFDYVICSVCSFCFISCLLLLSEHLGIVLFTFILSLLLFFSS